MAHNAAEHSVRQNRCYMQFDEFEMKCYGPEEVRRISVMEVEQATTFDEAGFPVKGGLYDPRMGADEEDSQICDTCGLGYHNCPGHFGHIELTVPVFNPLMYKLTQNLLKATCIHCHRFTFDSSHVFAKIAIAKVRALNFGVPEVLNSIESHIKKRIEYSELLGDRIELLGEKTLLEEIDKIIAELGGFKSIEELREKGSSSLRHKSQLKNNVNEWNNVVIKQFLKEYLFKRKVRCPRCNRPNGDVRNDFERAFLLDFTKQSNKIKGTKSHMKNANARLIAMRKAQEAPNENDSPTSKFGIEDDTQRPDIGFGGIEEAENIDMKKPNVKALNAALPSNAITNPLEISRQLLSEQLSQILLGKCDKLAWRAAEVREHLRLVWEHENILLKQIFPFFEEKSVVPSSTQQTSIRSPIDSLFIETVLVLPNRFRPIRHLKGDRYEHPSTINYRKLAEANQMLTLIKMYMQSGGEIDEKFGIAAKEMVENRVQGKTMNEKLHNAYLELQTRANCLFDQKYNRADNAAQQAGLRQLLEKKEGLFRMNMMGKRVNYACRSVITPDPYLDIDEIGIPELFAKRLTFPEPVSFLNIRTLRDLVYKGPAKHPGANFVEIAGKLGKQPQKIKLRDGYHMGQERAYQATRLQVGDTDTVHAMPDIVLRHLHNGDRLLMNRQPSLHKPSIMGHRARVLRGQNALRMNYAPCKAYNADFDGDEMNGHFVQSRVAQCEVAELANVGNNFLVPKDGTPILGLIQDHVVSGVLMTIRGRFFNKEDFMHLVLSAFSQSTRRFTLPPPAIIKPARLWSGKQVITAIMQNCCPPNKPNINLTGKSKTSINCWKARDPKTGEEMPAPQFAMSESEVIIRQGELLCGVLDKNHYGATQYGLIHCCFELYGPKVAVQILSCFSRVFTTHLQFQGFTLGVADILVKKSADKQRRKIIRQLRKCGEPVVRKIFGLPDDVSSHKIRYSLATAYNHPHNHDTVKLVDYSIKQAIGNFTDQINRACVPSGLIRDFPNNSLQLMIQSGAKGSLVNSIQISCALGQIELEGYRPPLSITGRSLPSFRSFDPSPRAGGFVEQRFLTGINPQELFFHTMAGREGLVDTAVKTSRSGYLQRCVIKHLEGLVVRYDQTVRDYDNSIIQFRYGEDGMDVGKATFLQSKQFPFLRDNPEALKQLIIPPNTNEQKENIKWNLSETEQQYKRISKFKRRRMKMREQLGEDNPKLDLATVNKTYRSTAFTEYYQSVDKQYLLKDSIVSDWTRLSKEEQQQYEPKYRKVPQPVDEIFHPTTSLGALPESLLDHLNDFVRNLSPDDRTLFKRAIYWKGLRSFVDPGECVGLLAAQSIGEPSTQMTLNTFHFAGRGEMNVTLGIPRLREILMTQSKNISTPMAEICVKPEVTDKQLEKIKSELNPIMLNQVLRKFTLEERTSIADDEKRERRYYREWVLKLELLKNEQRDPMLKHLKRRRILRELESRFANELREKMSKRHREVVEQQQIEHRKLRESNTGVFGEEKKEGRKKVEEEDLASDEEEARGGLHGEVDAHEARLNKRHLDDAAEYEGEDQDRGDTGILDGDEEEIVEAEQNEDVVEEVEDEEMEHDEEAAAKSKKRETLSEIADRVNAVIGFGKVGGAHIITDYAYDQENEYWCSFTFRLPRQNKGVIDANALIERLIDNFVVTRVKNIEKCVVREEDRNGRMTRILQTQGINSEAFYERSKYLDVNTIYSNDINWMLENFGVEAATRTIVKEMNNVFGVYGIEVNPRHLKLTADYMTFTGEVQAFNRTAMALSSSPLQRMTFETTIAFMQQAITYGHFDPLFSPSARLVLGQLIQGGTGAFDLLAYEEGGLEKAEKTAKPTSALGKEISNMRRMRSQRKMLFYS